PKTTQAPVVTDGQMTPRLFCEWKGFCMAFFATKNVDPDDQVKLVARGLRPIEIVDWYESQHQNLDAHTFEDFCDLLRPIALRRGWEQEERDVIENLTQAGRKAENFYFDILARNRILHDTGFELGEDDIRFLMNARFDRDLKTKANTAAIRNIVGFAGWLVAIFEADE
ncbi:hypothetical protein DFH11DRAFT_1490497, partial [Phellopilus nigrolimitatus]